MLLGFQSMAQIDINLELISRVDAFEGSNDVWGFEHSNGIEYAILGTRSNTKIYSLENPAFPIEVGVFPGPVTTWRDIKNFNDYVYVTTDGISDGLTIIDMTDVENIEAKIWNEPLWIGNTIDSLKTCHNIYIDDEGYGYLAGCNISQGGVIILDLFTDPLNPTMVGYADQAYSHDVYTLGNKMYTSDIFEGWFSVYDISDRSSPVRLATQETGTLFTHNAWTSEDGNFIFTTDERPDAYVEAYDISDLNNIQLVDTYRPPESEFNGTIPHNTHYLDGYLITSWYTDGVVVLDANKPDNLVKVAAFDTFEGDHGGYNGCWGAYPYLPSGLILASDRATGLYVFSPSYQRACYLEGNVYSAATGLAINGATISIEADQMTRANSDASGAYKTGLATAGMYNAIATHPEYDTTIVSVQLNHGEVTIQDFAMLKEGASIYNATVVNDLDGSPIPDAMIKLINSEGTIFDQKADENGNGIFEFVEGNYTFYASKWGYHIGTLQFDTATDPTIEIRLTPGYRDEFFFDHNWILIDDAERGNFEIGVPQELILNNQLLNVGADNQEDIGEQALLTGAGILQPAHLDYVFNGTTTAISPPMNLNEYDYPIIKMDAWYRHHGYTDVGPYETVVKLIRGDEERIVMGFDQADTLWQQRVFHPKDYFWNLENVQVSISVFNDIEGIFTELAIDVFEVEEGQPTQIDELESAEMLIYPNPSSDEFNISLKTKDYNQYILTDVNGQLMNSRQISSSSFKIDTQSLPPGIYFLQLKSENKLSTVQRLVKN